MLVLLLESVKETEDDDCLSDIPRQVMLSGR